MKIQVSPSKANFPMPAVLVSCQDHEKLNIIAISWITMISQSPPSLLVSFLKTRYSLSLIQKTMSFAVNIPSQNDVDLLNYCGTKSGIQEDKFQKTGYTPFYSDRYPHTPMILECPINMICQVVQSVDYEDRTLLIGKIEEIFMGAEVVKENNTISLLDVKPFVYWMSGGQYWDIKSLIGSVKDGKK